MVVIGDKRRQFKSKSDGLSLVCESDDGDAHGLGLTKVFPSLHICPENYVRTYVASTHTLATYLLLSSQ